jgi:hypothetical protein
MKDKDAAWCFPLVSDRRRVARFGLGGGLARARDVIIPPEEGLSNEGLTLIHHPFAYLAGYTVTVTAADDLMGHPLAGAPVAWHFATAPYRVCLPLAVRNLP